MTQDEVCNTDQTTEVVRNKRNCLLAAHECKNSPANFSRNSAPLSPYGVGEMIRAANIEVSVLDEYLHQAEIHGALRSALPKNFNPKLIASRRYQNQNEQKFCGKNATAPKLQLNKVAALNSAIQNALYQQPSKIQNSKNLSNQKNIVTSSNNTPIKTSIKQDLKPYAEKYVLKMGYDLESGEAQRVLKETVAFYSNSTTLADTLKKLVESIS